MKTFLDRNFLLENPVGEALYHSVASDLPIVDFHNHLDPYALSVNTRPKSISDLWIVSDPYKHRAMRINGVPEYFVSGKGSAEEKFKFWAATLPKTIGNPLFHWSCTELKYVFGIEDMLNERNAKEIWDACNKILAEKDWGVRDLLKIWGTEVICTSDDLLDNLSAHIEATRTGEGLRVYPSLRGDSMISFDSPGYLPWLERLQAGFGKINCLDHYQHAIVQRLDIFEKAGCRLADHSLDAGFSFVETGLSEAAHIIKCILRSQVVSEKELVMIRSYLLSFLGVEYAKRGWTLQLHIGAQRRTSSRLRSLAGVAGGYACIGKACDVDSLCRFLDTLEDAGHLPHLILYTLNPADNAVLATLTGSFAEDHIAGKVQFGPAWWYNDFLEGIRQQLSALSGYGLLSRFVGMTTDSRSVLSFSRHDYFRRILCNMLGIWVEKGYVPYESELLQRMVKDICYVNSKKMIENEI
jgi:glucuronate isomerase